MSVLDKGLNGYVHISLCEQIDTSMVRHTTCLIGSKTIRVQEYDRQQEDAALTDQEKQERQQKADADQAAMWESIGNVSLATPCLHPLPPLATPCHPLPSPLATPCRHP